MIIKEGERMVNEKMTPREKLLLFQTLELLRKQTKNQFSDWKDADDWLFSQLDFTVDEIKQVYKGRGQFVYTGSCVQLKEFKGVTLLNEET